MNITKFNHQSFGDIRVSYKEGQPWFVVVDICKSLGISNPTESVRNFDEDDLSTAEVIDSMRRKQNANVTNESGLYQLIFQSRKEEAKQFKKWVTNDVLPQIRKTGTYSEHVSFEQNIINVITTLQDKTLRLENKIEEDAPKVAFHDILTASDAVCKMAVACQVAELPFGSGTLYKKLREDGVLISGNARHNHPKQTYISRGLFTLEAGTYDNIKTGEKVPYYTPHVTQKGIDWLIKRYKHTQEGVA